MLAADCGQASVVEKLLEYGAEIDVRNEAGTTALMLAADCGQASDDSSDDEMDCR